MTAGMRRPSMSRVADSLAPAYSVPNICAAMRGAAAFIDAVPTARPYSRQALDFSTTSGSSAPVSMRAANSASGSRLDALIQPPRAQLGASWAVTNRALVCACASASRLRHHGASGNVHDDIAMRIERRRAAGRHDDAGVVFLDHQRPRQRTAGEIRAAHDLRRTQTVLRPEVDVALRDLAVIAVRRPGAGVLDAARNGGDHAAGDQLEFLALAPMAVGLLEFLLEALFGIAQRSVGNAFGGERHRHLGRLPAIAQIHRAGHLDRRLGIAFGAQALHQVAAHRFEHGLNRRSVGILGRSQHGTRRVLLDFGAQQAECAEYTRRRRHQQLPDAELARDTGGMNGSGAAERHHDEIPGIAPALDRY